jgi:quercetin dioxygenase-like cupin family protein
MKSTARVARNADGRDWPGAAASRHTPGISRSNLRRHDLSSPGRETIQLRGDFAPGMTVPQHSHPGEEIV